MLQTNKVIAIEVEKLRGSLIGRKLLLRKLQSNLLRVLVARVRIVDRDRKKASFTEFGSERGA